MWWRWFVIGVLSVLVLGAINICINCCFLSSCAKRLCAGFQSNRYSVFLLCGQQTNYHIGARWGICTTHIVTSELATTPCFIYSNMNDEYCSIYLLWIQVIDIMMSNSSLIFLHFVSQNQLWCETSSFSFWFCCWEFISSDHNNDVIIWYLPAA